MIAIRGAISVAENCKESIEKQSIRLFKTIVEENDLKSESFVSLIISVTKDLDAFNPATALREANLSGNIPLFCVQEAYFENSMRSCIRFLCLVNLRRKKVHHVYLDEAKKLRPDLLN